MDEHQVPGAAEASQDSTSVSAVAAAPIGCQTCGQPMGAAAPQLAGTGVSGWSGFVYAVGRFAPQFPSLGVEKEFAQLAGEAAQVGLFEIPSLMRALEEPENRYLGRHVCWVFNTQDIDSFTVAPRDDADISRLVEIIPSSESREIINVVVGRSWPGPPGAIDSPCAVAGLPTVVADQLLGFTLDEFAAALSGTAPESSEEPPEEDPSSRDRNDNEVFRRMIRNVFVRLTRRADNFGIADEHRALNYVALRYPPIYHTAMKAYREHKTLMGIDARHTHSTSRRVVSVRLTFRQHPTDIIERYHCLVDVTDVFPFLASPLTIVYD